MSRRQIATKPFIKVTKKNDFEIYKGDLEEADLT
jgi:hypothetical protein